tara:strand:- start:255 stop:821 length:567 start_codon:yes stop_codon:yes gene_type:complete
MSTTSKNEKANENFPNIEKLRGIMRKRNEENKKIVEVKKQDFEKNINAASEIYYDRLLQNIYDALNYMENANRNGNTMVYVNVPTDKIKWGEEGNEKFVPWHWLHYGFPYKSSKKWDERDLKSWTDNEEEMAFRRLQKLCYNNGYYLYDVSNPEKGNKTFVKISIDRREDIESQKLWHNFNTFLFNAE